MEIIINVDDFGKTNSINQAVFDLVSLKVISSTTVMVNMPYAHKANGLLQHKGFSIGLHFNLTEGSPISSLENIYSLVDKSTGCFFSYNVFVKKLRRNQIRKEHVQYELNAQWKALQKIIGNNISHIDSHQNIHKQFKVAKILCEFGKKHSGVYLRSPIAYFVSDKSSKIKGFLGIPKSKKEIRSLISSLYLRWITHKYRRVFKMPTGELHYESRKKIDFFNWLIKVQEIKETDNIYEVPCHPAAFIDDLGNSKLIEKRLLEYQLLISDDFQNALHKINLQSFKEF